MNWENKSYLEGIVRSVYNCDRCEAMGVANTDFLGDNPIAAALVCFAPFVKIHGEREEITRFIDHYSCMSKDEWEDDDKVTEYINELRRLVNEYTL